MSDDSGSNSEDGRSPGAGLDIPKLKNCCWCMKPTKDLVENRKYCIKCKDNMFRECRTCKRPLNSPAYFKMDPIRCNSCSKRLASQRNRKKSAKPPVGKVAKTDGTIDTPTNCLLAKLPPIEFYALLPIISSKELQKHHE